MPIKSSMKELLDAIVNDDHSRANTLLKREPDLANVTVDEARLYETEILHWIYIGDTALHLAAAGYRDEIVRILLNAGADPNGRQNHRHGTPLHYAANGYVNGSAFDGNKQVKTIGTLIEAGAQIQLEDKNGARPLHRAVRTRCAAAVKYLLKAGSDPTRRNRSGSTPFHLAVQSTGRGGTGAPVAREAQRQIILEFLLRGLDPGTLADRNGKSVFDSARSSWIRDLLRGHHRPAG